jgi:hypothetical protein
MNASLPIALALLTVALLPAYPQAAVDFRNSTNVLPEPPDRRVYFGDGPSAGTGVVGTQFVAQLFYASDAPSRDTALSAPDAVLEDVSHFRATALPGFWAGGIRTLDGTLLDQTKDYVIRVWDSSFGDGSYRDAYLGGAMVGQSASFSFTSWAGLPPCTICMWNFVGFSITTVPEPSTIMLVIVGTLAVCLVKRGIPRSWLRRYLAETRQPPGYAEPRAIGAAFPKRRDEKSAQSPRMSEPSVASRSMSSSVWALGIASAKQRFFISVFHSESVKHRLNTRSGCRTLAMDC